MSTVIEKLEREQLRRLPDFGPGDRVRFHVQVVEGTRRRTQVFEGVVIGRQGNGVRETATVRKESFGVGVERTFPLHSPKIEKIEVVARGAVRRAKLSYLRDRIGRKARVRERTDVGPEVAVGRDLLTQPEVVTDQVEADGAELVEAESLAADQSVTGSEAEAAVVEEVVDAAPAEEPAAEAPADDEVADTPVAEAPADQPVDEAPADEPAAAEESPAEEA